MKKGTLLIYFFITFEKCEKVLFVLCFFLIFTILLQYFDSVLLILNLDYLISGFPIECVRNVLNPLLPHVPFLYLLKTLENRMF